MHIGLCQRLNCHLPLSWLCCRSSCDSAGKAPALPQLAGRSPAGDSDSEDETGLLWAIKYQAEGSASFCCSSPVRMLLHSHLHSAVMEGGVSGEEAREHTGWQGGWQAGKGSSADSAVHILQGVELREGPRLAPLGRQCACKVRHQRRRACNQRQQ